jgi:hypothetical protein
LTRLLRNPTEFFGLSKGSRIVYSMLSITRSVVAETVLGDALGMMAQSRFFLEECQFNPDRKYTNQHIPLGNDIVLTAGSKGWHLIGRNVIGVALDEGNFRTEKNPDTKAYELFNDVRIRIKNRFQRIEGFLPAISIIASSARDESSFTEKIIQEIEREQSPTQRVYRYAAYDVRAHVLRLPPERFKVAYGLRNIDPVILSGTYDKQGNPLQGPFDEPPAGAKTVLIPINYQNEFKRRIKTSLQSICGITTGGSNRFFYNPLDIDRAVERAKEKNIINPCKITMIPLSNEDDKQIWDFLEHREFLVRRLGAIQPRRNPSAVRFAHIDHATTGVAGLSICHISARRKTEQVGADGKPFAEYKIAVEYDFILSIVPGTVKPISYEKIQKFFFWLRDKCGYSFALITADQFQSEMPLQMLEARGFNVGKLSLDRTKGPYLTWRTGFEEDCIDIFAQPVLMKEMEDLVDTGDKIDHPMEGTKDCADAAAGCYYDAVTYAAKEPGAMAQDAPMDINQKDMFPLPEEKPVFNPAVFEEAKRKPSSLSVKV